jgi:hypothetical protein
VSELRKQLDAMKGEYDATRYPGNLAADVLRPRRHLFLRIAVSAAALSAIAAGVALWMSIQPLATSPNKPSVATTVNPTLITPTTQAAQEVPVMSWTFSAPTFPQGGALLPDDASMSMPAMPSLPSFADIKESETQSQTDSTATTKEAV